MTLFDKISALETTFTTAKNDLQALQQSVQAHLESFVQESLETTKDKAKEFFTKERRDHRANSKRAKYRPSARAF